MSDVSDTADRLALAAEMVAITQTSMEGQITLMIEQLAPMMTLAVPGPQGAAIIARFREQMPRRLREKMVAAFADAFTHEELEHMVGFYRDPRTPPILVKIAETSQRFAAIGQQIGREIAAGLSEMPTDQ